MSIEKNLNLHKYPRTLTSIEVLPISFREKAMFDYIE